ncbi:putative RNA recognition motif (RRM, RBD, or RNP domain) [Leishmania utingensis]|uniref:RNA recognition motif (RRM, RBD, or RNP domain) n=1 Tax=Leishmania utingensis TaxID=653362 RepID=A0AAW3ATX9_9TRYP
MSYPSPFTRNVYIASLPNDYSEKDLLDLFSPFGRVITCTVKYDKKTGLCKGYGFVLFENEQDALNSVIALQGHTIRNTRIQVRLARPEASAKKMYPVMIQQQMMSACMPYQPVYVMYVPSPLYSQLSSVQG